MNELHIYMIIYIVLLWLVDGIAYENRIKFYRKVALEGKQLQRKSFQGTYEYGEIILIKYKERVYIARWLDKEGIPLVIGLWEGKRTPLAVKLDYLKRALKVWFYSPLKCKLCRRPVFQAYCDITHNSCHRWIIGKYREICKKECDALRNKDTESEA